MLINRLNFGGTEAYRLINEESNEYVEIITGFGGIINNFMVKNGNDLHSIIDGFENENDLKTNYQKVFKGVKLFPYANRIRDGKYEFEGRTYQLHINFPHENNSIHGLLLNKKFNVRKTVENSKYAMLEIEFNYNGEENGFPFPFNIRLKYFFNDENELELETDITNTGNSAFPFSDGWHPYFTFNQQINDIELELPSKFVLEVDDQMIPNGDTSKYDGFNQLRKIGATNFDSCFNVKNNSKLITTKLVNSLNSTEIDVWQAIGVNEYNYVQVYIPPARKSIAIEPMTAPPDVFNNKQDLIIINPSEIKILKCGINYLSKIN